MARTSNKPKADDAVEHLEVEATESDGRPGMWVRYVNDNPEDPQFETMDGYCFEKWGDFVMVKVDPDRAAKFKGNGNFRCVEEPDAPNVADGALKEAPDDRPRAAGRSAGKIAD